MLRKGRVALAAAIVTLCSAVVITSGGLLPAAADAGGASQLDELGDAMRRELARSHDPGLIHAGRRALGDPLASEEAVVDYLRLADAAGVLEREAEAAFGTEHFAGLAIDPAAGELDLYLAGAAPELSAAVAHELPRTEVIPVARSLAELRAIQSGVESQIESLAARGVTVSTIRSDVPSNRVVLGVASAPGDATAAVSALRPDDADVIDVERAPSLARAICQSRSQCPANVTPPVTVGLTNGQPEKLRGGIRITGAGYLCSSAFAARRTSDNAVVLLTAGHCFDQGTRIYHGEAGRIGTVSLSRFNSTSSRDGAVIRAEDSDLFRWVRNNWIYTDSNKEQTITQVYNRSGGSQAINAPLSKQGVTTNSTFGQVKATNETVVCSDANGCNPGGPTVTLTNLTRASVCAEPGDSGGGVHWGVVAHGIVSLAGNLVNGETCPGSPITWFNLASHLETELGVRINESP